MTNWGHFLHKLKIKDIVLAIITIKEPRHL